MQNEIVSKIDCLFEKFLDDLNGSEVVFLATLDGQLIFEKKRDQIRINKIASVSGSLIGISHSMGRKFLSQNLNHNIMVFDNDILGLFKVYDHEDSLFLGVICNKIVNLLSIKTTAKDTIDNLNHILHQIVL